MQEAVRHPLEPTNDDNPFATFPNKYVTADRQCLPRLRLLALHLISFLFEEDADYVFMIRFLREVLDHLEKDELITKIRLPPDCCSITASASNSASRKTHHENDSGTAAVDTLIKECLDSDLSDFEMASKLGEQQEEQDPVVSFPGETFLWQTRFNPEEYNIADFIVPLRTGNHGVIIKGMIRYGITTKQYDARIRTFILSCSHILAIEYDQFQAYELSAVDEIQTVEKYKKKKERMSGKSIAAVGVAATGGAVLMTLTGGLAAPFVVSGLASIVGTSSTAFLATTTGLAAIAATFGAVGGGLTGYKVSKLVGSIDEFEFVKVREQPSVALTIMVSGLTEDKKLGVPGNWKMLSYTNEQYLLQYESKHLALFTNALSNFLKDVAVSMAADELVRYTIFSALATSLTWPLTLLSLTSVIDNPWSVCMARSKAVGMHLSWVLTQRLHGDRPVTLVGYGLGARVIFFCLLDLVKRNTAASAGILENAVMCGAPVTSHHMVWDKLSRAVSGRIINGYSSNDWVLSFLYKTSRATRNVAGIKPVGGNSKKIVNVDLSSIITGHADYATKMGDVLNVIGMARQPMEIVSAS